MGNKKEISPEYQNELIRTLKVRFEKNMNRHKDLDWDKLFAKLKEHLSDNPDSYHTEKIWSLN